MTFGPYVGVRIHGEDEVIGRVRKFRVTTMDRMVAEVQEAADTAVSVMQNAMHAEYQSGSGDLAAGVQLNIHRGNNEIEASFSFPGLRELSFVTALGGGYFSVFPVGPYQIYPVNGKFLRIQFSDGVVHTRVVTHPGFTSDVIAETGASALEALVLSVTRAIDGSVAELVME